MAVDGPATLVLVRERLRRWRVVVAILIVSVVVLPAVLLLSRQDEGCPGETVYHLAAGTCMDPTSLLVIGEQPLVEAAIARHDGSILFTTRGSHHVRFPVNDPAALDRIKDELAAAGFDVRYSLVLEFP
jgi:hypothetical protein